MALSAVKGRVGGIGSWAGSVLCTWGLSPCRARDCFHQTDPGQTYGTVCLTDIWLLWSIVLSKFQIRFNAPLFVKKKKKKEKIAEYSTCFAVSCQTLSGCIEMQRRWRSCGWSRGQTAEATVLLWRLRCSLLLLVDAVMCCKCSQVLSVIGCIN